MKLEEKTRKKLEKMVEERDKKSGTRLLRYLQKP